VRFDRYPKIRSCRLRNDAYLQSWSEATSFSLEFHIPYPVWRSRPSPLRDRRCLADRTTPRRRTDDIAFLNRDGEDGAHWLQQAKISCVVTGLNNTTWDACCFADIYFDGDDSLASVSSGDADGLDPLLRGENHGVGTPFTDPREYFLMVLKCQLGHIRQEWRHVVRTLRAKMERYVSSSALSITGISAELTMSPRMSRSHSRVNAPYDRGHSGRHRITKPSICPTVGQSVLALCLQISSTSYLRL
jgi:hypothetical protein